MKLRYLFAALLCLCLLIAPAAAAGGSGTAASPYIIETAAELQSIQNDLSAYYRLANDIDLSGVTWTPIGSQSAGFYGSFDGNGKTIKNLALRYSSPYAGFFSVVTSGAVIKDVTFQDCSVTTTNYICGVVIGQIIMSSAAHETAVISNVDVVRCTASSSEYYAGGLVSNIYTHSVVEITGCNILDSHVRGTAYDIGGFVGKCNSAGGVTTSVVIDSSSVQNSIIESIESSGVGGLVGTCDSSSSVSVSNSEVVNCLVKGTEYIGGLFGINWTGSVEASACSVTGCTLVATTNYAGGIAGRIASGQQGIFSGCTVTDSAIIAPSYAAGICPAYS